MNYSSLEQLFGSGVANITIRDLAKMMSNIPDFDTAKGRGSQLEDSFRATLYANPTHMFGPLEILSLPWVYNGTLLPPSPYGHAYSSTNFLLLGLILAKYTNASNWDQLDQLCLLPASLRDELRDLRFSTAKPPSDYTPEHGYDCTGYNGHDPSQPLDVSNVDGVFSGWTASNTVGSVSDVASMVQSVYGSQSFLSEESKTEMIPKANESFYGFATFNLTGRSGLPPPLGTAYGHLGATYGFQSIVAYFPHFDFTIAVASNIETNFQAQPSAGLCFAFSKVLAVLNGTPVPACTYTVGSYYSSGCNCSISSIS